MKPLLGLVLVALVSGLGLRAAPAGVRTQDPAPQQPTFRGIVDSVAVDVSVLNGTSVVTNLVASDFHVLDNGIRQEVAIAIYGKLPIDVTVALDVSYSERGAPLARLERGVLALTAGLGHDDRLRLIAFNQDVHRVLDFTASQQAIVSALGGLSANGGTSIFDALASAMIAPSDPGRRQLVTVFTDGDDTASITEPRQLLDAGKRSQATVSVVMPRTAIPARPLPPRLGAPNVRQATPDLPPVGIEYERLLSQLTDLTGGRLIPDPGPPADLGPAFRLALDTLRSSYVLFFTPRGVTRDGFHTLTVSVPSHSQYAIHARSGYFGS